MCRTDGLEDQSRPAGDGLRTPNPVMSPEPRSKLALMYASKKDKIFFNFR